MNNFGIAITDAVIAAELFSRLEKRRKQMGITQTALSERLNITPKTYRSMKDGSCSLMIFLMVLRELNLVENLESLIPKETAHPRDILIQEESQRQAPQAQLSHGAPKNSVRTGVAAILQSRKKLK